MFKKIFFANVMILFVFFVSVFILNKSVTAFREQKPVPINHCVVIDPGHGGIDGGATSVTGTLESHLNLEISLRLRDLCNFLGINTKMIRVDDRSVHTEGESIAQKKVSDLKNRVQIANEQNNAILVSIHQNYFADKKYYGAQVFYSDTRGSEVLALEMQHALVGNLYPESNRKTKKASRIYLMDHINCTGVLIECSFISNYEDAIKIEDVEYQKKLSSVIATTLTSYINEFTVS